MSPKKIRLPEKDAGSVLFNLDPLIMKWHYEIDYLHSYAQDSPFFIGLSQGELRGSACTPCQTIYATPRGCCLTCGKTTNWITLPTQGIIHTFTTCYFGGKSFLDETPFTLILVEFEGVDTLFLSRLIGAQIDTISIGDAVEARFLRKSQFLATDVYFVRPQDESGD